MPPPFCYFCCSSFFFFFIILIFCRVVIYAFFIWVVFGAWWLRWCDLGSMQIPNSNTLVSMHNYNILPQSSGDLDEDQSPSNVNSQFHIASTILYTASVWTDMIVDKYYFPWKLRKFWDYRAFNRKQKYFMDFQKNTFPWNQGNPLTAIMSVWSPSGNFNLE